MNYELAKKLKEAGFPKENFHITLPNCKYPDGHGQRNAPTLEELIEACGDNFQRLMHYPKWKKPFKEGKWKARGWQFGGEHHHKNAYGETPSEAVANLWLKLQEK